LSPAVVAAGLRVVTTETLVASALENVEVRYGDSLNRELFAKVENALWEQLGPAIDSEVIEEDEADRRSPLGQWAAEAVRVHDADVLIAADPRLLDMPANEALVIVSPTRWLALANDEIRKMREAARRSR
jgi:hypothetical protein